MHEYLAKCFDTLFIYFFAHFGSFHTGMGIIYNCILFLDQASGEVNIKSLGLANYEPNAKLLTISSAVVYVLNV